MLHLQRKRISFHFEAKLLTNSVEAILVPPFGKIRNGKWSFKNQMLTKLAVIVVAGKID